VSIPTKLLSNFSDPGAVARYIEGPPRFMPGFSDLHRMIGILLAETAPANARVLVLGGGGGLELKALATMHPDWRFDGVDPSAPMLALAARVLGPDATRVHLHEGLIDIAPEGPFEAATILLTLHFLDPAERLRTLRQVHKRLRPGAPCIVAHMSYSREAEARAVWLSRYAAFAVASGVDPAIAEQARVAVAEQLLALTPEEDEALLLEAGFHGIETFYRAFTWQGWIAVA
jgi:tRNA (cmo5U34)-methyltransferase